MLRLFPTLLCTLLLSLATEVRAISYTVEITQQELQEKVEAMMPLKKKKLFVLVTLSEPQVELISESNEIGLQAKISIAGPGISESGIANIKGTLEYRPEKGWQTSTSQSQSLILTTSATIARITHRAWLCLSLLPLTPLPSPHPSRRWPP